MSTFDWLYRLRNRGSKLGLERMQAFAEVLGNPQYHYPTVHVAGSNGKGSVCAMLEGILGQSGYKTGLFTSPHLVHLGERVQVNRQELPTQELEAYINELKAVADQVGDFGSDDYPTFFEFMTAMAFEHFKRSAVDVAIIETGLGGRLDSTNIQKPSLTVITSISLEHTDLLGKTLTAIAQEKAGIIKPSVPVVLGLLPQEAEIEIRRCAQEKGAPVFSVREVFGECIEQYPETNLFGECQRINAAIATLACRVLGEKFLVQQAAMESALQAVYWPGRWQQLPLGEGKQLILDATHNAEAAAMLRKNLESLEKPITAIVGILGEERAPAVMEVLSEFAQAIILVKPDQPRALSTAVLEDFIPASFQGKVQHALLSDVFPGEGVCTYGQPEETLLLTGSIYLIGEALALLAPEAEGSIHFQDKL